MDSGINPAIIAELRTRLRQAVEAYAAGGRRFEELDARALQKRFRTTLKAWCTRPTHAAAAREFNDVNCEHLLRRLDIPFEPIRENLEGFIPIPPNQDAPSDVAIAVVILRESSPPGVPMIHVPNWGCLLLPKWEKYGDHLKAPRSDEEQSLGQPEEHT